jgi:hypothetical protein
VSCGILGESCCAAARGGYCGAPYVCRSNSNQCLECGDQDEPCCPGRVCHGGLTCRYNNTCGA